MPHTVIETDNYTLTVFSAKEEIEKLEDPLQDLSVDLEKAGLKSTGNTISSPLGVFVDCHDVSGELVRVKVTRK